MLHRHHAPELARLLEPLQLGVGTRHAADAMVRAALAKKAADDGLCFLDFDIKAAYPSLDRQSFMQAVQQHMPGAARWVASAYGMKTKLLYNNWRLWSSTGGRQGDPFMGAIYCVTQQKVLTELAGRLGAQLALQVWYVDGGLLAFHPEDGEQILTALCSGMESLGLKAAWDKCGASMHIPLSEEFAQRFGGRPRVVDLNVDVIKVMGIPLLATRESAKIFFKQKLEKVESLLKAILELDDAHCGQALQRFTASYCKVVHMIRALPLDVWDGAFKSFLKAFDRLVLGHFDRIVRISTRKKQRRQLALPFSLGGFGLRSAYRHAHAAYIAGALNSAPLVARILGWQQYVDPRLDWAIDQFNEVVRPEDRLERETLNDAILQKKLSERIDSQLLETYKRKGTVRDRARINSLQLPHSLDLLQVIPDQRHHLSNLEFQLYVQFLLGDLSEGTCEQCGADLDESGFHALSCSTGGRLKKRHDDVVHEISRHVRLAGFRCSEDVAIMRDGPNRPRPADIRVRNMRDGRDVALDITFIAPLQQKFINRAAEQKGVAVEAAERKKRNKYLAQCRQHDVDFIPVAAESYGGWGHAAIEAFEIIIAMEGTATQRSLGRVRRDFYSDLAIVIARNVAGAIRERSPEVDVVSQLQRD